MEKFTENIQEYPKPDYHGEFKEHTSGKKFMVSWWNANIESTTTEPGIYIRMYRPDRELKEEKFFPFGKETEAEDEYQRMVEIINKWDNIS